MSVKVTETALPGVLIIEPQIHRDDRGFFIETWREDIYRELGIAESFVQDNHSRSTRNVLRGLHCQKKHPQGKLVRVGWGRIFDVVVDINPASPTLGGWVGVELSDESHFQLYVAPGYAHGFCTLSDNADVFYKCTAYYDAADEIGVRWNDPDIGISWPIENPRCSAKDGALPLLRHLHGV